MPRFLQRSMIMVSITLVIDRCSTSANIFKASLIFSSIRSDNVGFFICSTAYRALRYVASQIKPMETPDTTPDPANTEDETEKRQLAILEKIIKERRELLERLTNS
jgi:Rad3-related DNA helicase